MVDAVLLQLLAAPQVPGIQAGVFAAGPELIARDIHTSGPKLRDFVLPGGKERRGLCLVGPPGVWGPERP